MPLLTEQLSVWEIGFRWAGLDPGKLWLRIPLAVRDHFRTLIGEIYESRLECLTLRLEKHHRHDPNEARLHLHHWLPAIEGLIAGKSYDRKLLQWAQIDRHALFAWCEHHAVPLPEFWFPPGWGPEYEWPDPQLPTDPPSPVAETAQQRRIRIEKDHRVRMACQQIALWLWSKHPEMALKDVVLSKEIQDMCGAQHYDYTTVKHWIQAFEPHTAKPL